MGTAFDQCCPFDKTPTQRCNEEHHCSFHGDECRSNAWFSLLKQTYLLNSRLLSDMVDSADLDAKRKHKLRFFARQFVDAMSPANFPLTNPESLRLALESKGDSIRAG